MTSTTSHRATVADRPARKETRSAGRTGRKRIRRERGARRERPMLGRYVDLQGWPRELLARPGIAGSVLVLDRDATTLGDRRLVAHLAPDEPPENAAFVCRSYLQEPLARRRRCRLVTQDDFQAPPLSDEADLELDQISLPDDAEVFDPRGRSYRLERLTTDLSIPELRWRRCSPGCADSEAWPLSVREVISSLECYQPVRSLTQRALAFHRGDPQVSTAVLRVELARVQESPIVLNRRLREVVLATVELQGLSMSELAMRCGRIKRDRSGNESGETSWLARRLGILPEGGKDAPTPWIHSDVLALIARSGLGISPREVELE